ncbi:transposase [Streptomyces sp. T1317-0309]|nr:transposase [Streptomyces sp. T1317-0309]
MRADNSAHLAEAAQQRRLACIERVHAVLDALERDGGAVTVAGVAARAGVSRTFLYDAVQAPLLARLRGLADKQPSTGRPALPEQQRITTRSHETVVRALRDANRKLHDENERLRNELAVALGQLRDLRRGVQVPRG